ncbi:MAG: hypothetical protein KAI47_20550 [Deltaproteobacteria bacterium]|nr:hypothetical protein [Deltaproteobacteria bacterium]
MVVVYHLRDRLFLLSIGGVFMVATGCGSLSLAVRATQPQLDHPAKLQVTLARQQASGEAPDCLRLSAGATAKIDGVALQLKDRGGLDAQGHRCRPARFVLGGATRPGPAAESVVVVEDGDLSAEMHVANLLVARRPRITPGRTLRAGDRVTLTWEPKSDRVFPPLSGLGLFFYGQADGFSGQLGAHRIERVGRRYRFTLPPMRVGKVKLRLEPGAPQPRVKVLSCGVAHCEGGPALPARPITLTIVE